jgi:flavin reductase (DIM6/NTAB) family NADH-FMN oxidoreductase RutF
MSMTDRAFREYDWRSMGENVWKLIGDEWMLVTAGSLESWNTMTASWGGFGHLWNEDVVFAFVRPTRHTFGFMESSEGFTLSFFGPGRRDALSICGSTSGRDTDKARSARLTPRGFSSAAAPERVSFAEARLVLSCRKLHAQDLDPACFVDRSIESHYADRDWHRVYVGQIEAAWIGEGD